MSEIQTALRNLTDNELAVMVQHHHAGAREAAERGRRRVADLFLAISAAAAAEQDRRRRVLADTEDDIEGRGEIVDDGAIGRLLAEGWERYDPDQPGAVE